MDNLVKEAKEVLFNSSKYWELRCKYREKMQDETYSKNERDNCFILWKILQNRCV